MNEQSTEAQGTIFADGDITLPLTDERILADALKEWIEKNEKTMSFVSKAMGISTAALSQWLAEKYTGDNAKLGDKVKAFLALQESRQTRKKCKPSFIITSVAARVNEACKLTHEDGFICVVVSEAGYGKTEGLRAYTKKHSDVIYLSADSGYNAQAFFSEIHKLLFGECSHMDLHDMHVNIIKAMKNSGRMIIVDQAEYLPVRALEMLRTIYDEADIGIVLAGLPRLLENIRGKRGQHAQLHSRIGMVVKLNTITEADAKLILDTMLEDSSDVYKLFYKKSNANAREMVKMAKSAVRLSHINKTEIDQDIITLAEIQVRV